MMVSSFPYGLTGRTAQERGVSGLLEWLDFCAEHNPDGVEVGEDWLQRHRQSIHILEPEKAQFRWRGILRI